MPFHPARLRSGSRRPAAPLSASESLTADLDLVHESATRLDLASTISTLGHGAADPCHRVLADGSIWRCSDSPAGPVSYRLSQVDPHRVRCQIWGPGAADFAAGLPDLLGENDTRGSFVADHPTLQDAHRRHPGLRIPRTNRVLESLIPAILEQKVTSFEALRAWRQLVSKFGAVPPGPAPAGMRVPPTAHQWRHIPSWEFHRAGVDPRRARTVVECARLSAALEACSTVDSAVAQRRLITVPGVGCWTAAEVAQRAWGDADALSVGDYHLCGVIGWSLLGRPIDDDEMVEYLAPYRPHRHRVVRLLYVSGNAVKPRFGPRVTIEDHRRR